MDNTETAEVKTPEVDLSAVPENHREYVDTKKYVEDADYKRAIDHGYKPKEVYLAEGGDEDLYMTAKMFNKRYDDRQKEKKNKSEIAELRRSMEAMANSFNEQKEFEIRKAVAELEAKQKEAKANGDIDLALSLDKEISQTKQNTPQRKGVEPLPVRSVRLENDVVNPDSEDYDPEIDKRWNEIMAREAKDFVESTGRQLFLPEIRTIAEEALKMITKPKRETPKPPVSQKPAANKTPNKPKMSASQQDAYNMILQKAGKAAAERFKTNLGV